MKAKGDAGINQQDSREEDAYFDAITDECARLMPYGVWVRYSNNTELYEEDIHALEDAEKIIDIVRHEIEQIIKEPEETHEQYEAGSAQL